ncbi:TipJ family phage tail tip protein, partial [Sphingobium sp. LSP13-1-1.1]|uniref:TipJ family phage tail tip protein n=1 Tax=Sphingobium sp. LSP13-1-1.1 TaxID=3135234 RepID=UPI00342B191B
NLLALVALGDGPIGGIVGNTTEEKEKNIYINNQPLRDHGTNNLTFQGVGWDERFGEEGQALMKLVPGITNNVDANVDLPQRLSEGGSQHYHEVTVNNLKADKARVRLMVKGLVDTNNKKGNQKKTSIAWGIDVKRQSSAVWIAAGTYSYKGKSSQPIVLERVVNEPDQPKQSEGDHWQFRIYRITEDSGSDKLQNETAFNGHVEIQSIDLPYDGSDTSAPTALLGLALDLEQFQQGGNYPEVMARVRGRKVRVPVNYDPKTRTYSGVWNGSWKEAATQNPVWHWLHIATDQKQGLGFPDDYFLKYDLYQIAKFNDENVNGRPRYTLNHQFRQAQNAWPFLVELATTFRAFPYFDGQRVILVQDNPAQTVAHYVNNTQTANGFFDWQNTELSKQYNEVLVEWYDPNDFFNKKTVRYRDEASITRNRNAGLAAGGVIRATFEKIGCTNKQEAYDFARMLCYVSQHENETVSFDTLIGAAGYQPGQLIEIDDILVSHKPFTGRVAAADANGIYLDYPWTQKANKSYTIHAVVNNQLVLRPIPVVFVDTTSDFIPCDATGMDYGTPFGIVEAGGAQPRVARITNIEDKGDGLYSVTATLHVAGKYAWVEQNIPVPQIPYSDLKR